MQPPGLRDWAVQPPQPGGATAQAMSSSGTGQCNRPSQEVQPPRAQSPSETGRCNLLCQEVAPPELKFRALTGGATTELRLRALPGGATTELSLRALPGGATIELSLRALAERCNRLSSVFELCQAVPPLLLFQLTWFGSKLGPNQSELGPNWPLLGL